MNREAYRCDVGREGRWWIIDVPEIGYTTQATSLAEVDEMARDLIAGALDIEPASFDLDVHVETPADVAADLADVARAERAARAETARAARSRAAAASRLRREYGVSAVDAARLLGVTRGRVYQLLNEADSASA